jgi:hypothetical protein
VSGRRGFAAIDFDLLRVACSGLVIRLSSLSEILADRQSAAGWHPAPQELNITD